ncbi:MAG: isochorismatase family protein [Sphingobacterium sp.]
MKTLERLNVNDITIVLADLQPEIIASANRTLAEKDLRKAVSILVEGAEILDIPVFISVVSLHPDLYPNVIDEISAYVPTIRSTSNVLDDGPSLERFSTQTRSTIILGGVATELVVVQSALEARRLGYDVHLLTDVCGGLSERTEKATFKQLEGAGVTLSSVAVFLSSLLPPTDDPRFALMFRTLGRFLDN